MKWILFPVLLTFSLGAWANGRTMSITHMQTGPAYFTVNVNEDGPMKGTHQGWCADWNTRIEDGQTYNAGFWSTLAQDVPTDVVDHPEYLDEANWIFNQHFVGKPAPNGMGTFTIGDVQLAVWSLVDDEFNTDTVGEYSQARVDYIVERAKVEGSGFEPNCRQLVGIILLPSHPDTGRKVQNTIVLIPRYKFRKCQVPDTDQLL